MTLPGCRLRGWFIIQDTFDPREFVAYPSRRIISTGIIPPARSMNPDRWTYRWLLIVPFLVGALISHRWKVVLPHERSARIPTSKTKYLPTPKEAVKIAHFLSTDQLP